jgi:WD40 repeat protein
MIAEEREKDALEARDQSDRDRKTALAAREEAEREKSRAEEMSVRAGEEARIAEEERQSAEEQKAYAQAAEKEAKRLNVLSTAQNLALISLTLEGKPDLMGLLAVQAFNFNINNGGYVDDPVIFKALDKAFGVLDRSKHSIMTGPAGEIRSMAEFRNGILGADLDGKLTLWDQEGTFTTIQNSTLPSFIDFIQLSPEGDQLLTGYENNRLVIRYLTGNDPQNYDLKSHYGRVTTSSWNSEGNYVATGGIDSLIIIHKTEQDNSVPGIVLKARSAIRSLIFCNSDTLVSSLDDGSVWLWNITNYAPVKLFELPGDRVLSLAWDRERGNIIAGTSTGSLIVCNIHHRPSDRMRFQTHTSGISHLIITGDCSMIATAGWDRAIHIYNYHEFFELSQTVKGMINIETPGLRVRSMIFTRDNRIVAGMSDRTLRIWETSSRKLASKICKQINRNMTDEEWSGYIGRELSYEITCGNNQ